MGQSMRRIASKLFFIYFFLFSSLLIAENRFEKASQLFHSGEYQAAHDLFVEVKNSGNNSPQLLFNLASVNLKLHNFKAARELFIQLSEHLDWKTSAHFYLGYIAEKGKDYPLAKQYYDSVSQQDSHPKLKTLARRRMFNLSEAGKIAKTSTQENTTLNSLYLTSLKYGIDSNPVAIAESFRIASEELDDTYTEIFLLGKIKPLLSISNNISLQGYILRRQYTQFDSLSTNTYNLGISHETSWLGWEFDKSAGLSINQLDNSSFYQQLETEFTLQKQFETTQIKLDFAPTYINGDSQFDYLTGSDMQLGISAEWLFNKLALIAKYGLTKSNREGINTEENVYSYSPLKQALGTKLKYAYSDELSISVDAQFIHSSYSGKDRLIDADDQLKIQKRKSDLINIYLSAKYQFDPGLYFDVNYGYERNNENFDLYSFKRHELSISVNYLFK